MSRLYLIRHGQASFGRTNYDQLSDLGRRQAELTGEHLRLQGLTLDAAYAGSQARQQDTAMIALSRLADPPPLQVLPELNEYDSGAIMETLLPVMLKEVPDLGQVLPSMFSDRRSFQVVYEGAMARWISGLYDMGAAETWRSFQERLDQALSRVRSDNGRGKTVALFTSGGPISAAMRLAMGLSDEAALRLTWSIKNASISSIFYDDDKITLSTFNCTIHLEELGEQALLTYR